MDLWELRARPHTTVCRAPVNHDRSMIHVRIAIALMRLYDSAMIGNTTIIAVWAWGLRPSRGSGTAQLQNVVTVSCMLTAGSEMRSNVVCNSVSSLSSEGVWLDLEKRFKWVKRALSEAVRESGRRGGTDETSHHGSVPVLRSGGVCVRVNVKFVWLGWSARGLLFCVWLCT